MTTTVGSAVSRLREHVAERHAPPETHDVDAFLYGLTRPASAVLLLARRPRLLRAGLVPAFWLAVGCAAYAYLDHDRGHYIARFYELFALLAPFPSIVFARYYARMAVLAWEDNGGGPSTAWIEPLMRSVRRTIAQTLLISFGLAPLMLLRLIPQLGPLVFKIILAVWALHWIVVDAFDSARVLLPGQTVPEREAAVKALPSPWFVRLVERVAAEIPFLGGLLRRFARVVDRLSLPWRDEVALIAERPVMMTGFALSTALLMCTPVVNLLFRPIILVAAANTLIRLGAAAPGALPAEPASSATTPPSPSASPPEAAPESSPALDR